MCIQYIFYQNNIRMFAHVTLLRLARSRALCEFACRKTVFPALFVTDWIAAGNASAPEARLESRVLDRLCACLRHSLRSRKETTLQGDHIRPHVRPSISVSLNTWYQRLNLLYFCKIQCRVSLQNLVQEACFITTGRLSS
jgi:hypothetical protein